MASSRRSCRPWSSRAGRSTTRPTNGWWSRSGTDLCHQLGHFVCPLRARAIRFTGTRTGTVGGRRLARKHPISEILMKKTLARVLAAVTIAATFAATATDASAQWRRGWGGPGWGWHGGGGWRGGGWGGPGVGVGIAAG